MAGQQINLDGYFTAAKAEADLLVATFRDKGAKRFGKAFGIGAFFVLAAYFGVYMPPQHKISRLQREIDAARAMSEFGATYQALRDQLAGSYGTLPLMKDRKQWLSNAMRDSLVADGLTPELFRPVIETEASGLIFQTSTVSLTLRFNELYLWLLRLESATPLMHVYNIDVAKKTDMLGWNTVSASVMTAIPKKRFN